MLLYFSGNSGIFSPVFGENSLFQVVSIDNGTSTVRSFVCALNIFQNFITKVLPNGLKLGGNVPWCWSIISAKFEPDRINWRRARKFLILTRNFGISKIPKYKRILVISQIFFF